MGLLDKLWDDTLAGPQPETGLGKLRKHPTFSSRPSNKESDRVNGENETIGVTRSIMIIRSSEKADNGGSPPISPAGSTPPVSPFSGGRELHKFRRRSASDAYEKSKSIRSGFDI